MQRGRPEGVDYLQHLREDLGGAAYDIPCLQVILAAGKIADQSARLRNQQTAGRHVPGHQAEFPEAVQAAAGHRSQIQGGGLRDALMAPVEGDGEAGFSYDRNEAERFELPGLWLNSEELHALLAAQQLLAKSSGGMLSSALAPLQQLERLQHQRLLPRHT